MPVPVLTQEQRVAASAKAVVVRVRRAEVKSALKSKVLTLKQLIQVSESDDIIAGMKVKAVLESLPAIGKIKAKTIMEKCEIAPSRRLKGLGEHQVQALLNELNSRQVRA